MLAARHPRPASSAAETGPVPSGASHAGHGPGAAHPAGGHDHRDHGHTTHGHAAHSHDAHAPARTHAAGHPGGHAHTARRPVVPGASLLRLAVWQRLAIVVPLAGLLWAAALWVIAGGSS